VRWTFDRKPAVDLATGSSSCELVTAPGDSITVEVATTIQPAESYVPDFVEFTDALVLSEDRKDGAIGTASRRVTVPPGMEERFTSDSVLVAG
jgi:hypothetical protein